MNNLLLYGSYARNDIVKNSDVDLLSIGESDFSKKIIQYKVNLTQYPYKILTQMAVDGSLFIFHLKTEGKILVDNGHLFESLFNDNFILKNSYNQERAFSLSLLKEIFSIYEYSQNFTYANSKILWCIRTIFASIGAESKMPLFSTESIKDYFGNTYSKLLGIKHSTKKTQKEIAKIIDKMVNIVGDSYNDSFSESLMKYREQVLNTLKNEGASDNSSQFY